MKKDKRYKKLTSEELELRELKSTAYSAGGELLGNFYRVGNILSNYLGLDPADPRVDLLILLLKHLDAILINLANHRPLPDFTDRSLDIAVYAKLLVIMEDERVAENRI